MWNYLDDLDYLADFLTAHSVRKTSIHLQAMKTHVK